MTPKRPSSERWVTLTKESHMNIFTRTGFTLKFSLALAKARKELERMIRSFAKFNTQTADCRHQPEKSPGVAGHQIR